MTRYALLVAAIGAVLVFSSCVLPAYRHQYYRPEASGGELRRTGCKKSHGPQEEITFVFGDVKFSTMLTRGVGYLSVRVEFEIPEGNTVDLHASKIEVISPNQVELNTVQLGVPFYGQKEPNAPMLGRSSLYRHSWWAGGDVMLHASYSSSARIGLSNPSVVRLRYPEFSVNGNRFRPPDVTFYWDQFIELMMPLNC